MDVDNLQIVDSQKAKTLIKFKNLGMDGIKIDLEPKSANIKAITIKAPVLNVAINKDGSLNLNKIVKQQPVNKQQKTEPTEKQDNTKIPIKIGKVAVEKGQLLFNDKSVTPNFNTKLTSLNASVTGLSSEETIQSDIKIKTLVNTHTPVEISGKINPLKTDFFCDMIIKCSDMDLGYLSPYSGKYAGYKVQKGKLSLDLKYLVDKRKIDSENDIFLDQFDFGEEVESKDAINAPMRLAVSLLKDPMGRIALDIPVKKDMSIFLKTNQY